MELEQLLKTRRKQILMAARKHGAYDVRVFGSLARGEARPDSDIDFLVKLESGRSLLDLARLLRELQALLGHNVDVVTEAPAAAHPPAGASRSPSAMRSEHERLLDV